MRLGLAGLLLTFIGSVGCARVWYQPEGGVAFTARESSAAKTQFKTSNTPRLYRYPELSIRSDSRVHDFIRHYRSMNSKYMDALLERRANLFPKMEAVFASLGLPSDLLNLAIVESNLRPNAKGTRGALGLWQFMPQTARNYGLQVSFLRDDRRDVEKSTKAAAMHLSDLYDRYQDWHLALAAYNCGVGCVDRAIRRFESTDYFELSAKGALPKTTIDYVPRVLALKLLFLYPERFGISSADS